MWAKIGRTKALCTGVISSPSFTGTGTDDILVAGNPAFAASRSYRVVIDSTSETFKWSNDGGSTFEETGIPIEVRVPRELRNAEGELEGITIAFNGQSGHVNTDRWDFTTTGDVVSTSEVDLGAGVIVNSGAGEGLILHGQYVKGTEDGLLLKVVPLMAGSSSSYHNEISLPLNLGNGVIRHQQEVFEMVATSNYTYRVNLIGISAFKVRQVRSGAVGVTGLFTCNAEIYKVSR